MEALFDELVTCVRDSAHDKGFDPLAKHPHLRAKLAEAACKVRMSRLLSYRVAWQQSHGSPPSYEASLSKLVATELAQKMTELGMEVLGLYGQVGPGRGAKLPGQLDRPHPPTPAVPRLIFPMTSSPLQTVPWGIPTATTV